MSKKLITPKGIAVFPKLIEPDNFKGQNKYKVSLKLDPQDKGVEEFLAEVDKQSKEAFDTVVAELNEKGGKAKARAKSLELYLPYEPEYDEDGEETGKVLVKLATSATYKDKKGNEKEKKLTFFDAKGKKFNPSAVWGGSEIKIAYSFSNPWENTSAGNAGISLYINAVQVIELVAGGGGNADSYGFGEEDGFDASDETEGFGEEDGYEAPEDSDDGEEEDF